MKIKGLECLIYYYSDLPMAVSAWLSLGLVQSWSVSLGNGRYMAGLVPPGDPLGTEVVVHNDDTIFEACHRQQAQPNYLVDDVISAVEGVPADQLRHFQTHSGHGIEWSHPILGKIILLDLTKDWPGPAVTASSECPPAEK